MKEYSVPVENKLLLTIEEMAAYSNIGQGKLRELTKERNCDFTVMVGTKVLINRKKFERYIDAIEVL